MSTNATEIVVANSVLSRAQLDAPVSFHEAMAELGLAQAEMVLMGSAYLIEKDKDKLLSLPFYIREVRFAEDAETGNEYAVLYVVTERDEQLIITDGSTGIHAQISAAVQARIASDHVAPFNGYIIPNGLRKSEYSTGENGAPLTKEQLKAGVKPSGKGVTYYFA
jgi:hypothetical protein